MSIGCRKDTARIDVTSWSFSMRFSSRFITPFFDYENEHEDDDECEKQSSMVSNHWWAMTTVRKRIYATLV
jgi:hypothetical protein